MNDFKIITFDVEHGNCHVLVTPNNHYFMIDAGSTDNFSPIIHLKNNWGVSQLRWLIITHHDSDHLTDISNIDEYLPPMTLSSPDITVEKLSELYDDEFSTPCEVFLEMKKRYSTPALPLSHEGYDWGGVQFANFCNDINDLDKPNINDISTVTFVKYMAWTLIFPGDLEEQGWLKLMEKESFVEWLGKVDIFVASHHGRESGYCDKVFAVCKPKLTIVSDKELVDTSVSDKYYKVSKGITVRNPIEEGKTRYVLTTRTDGVISINITTEGRYKIKTSK